MKRILLPLVCFLLLLSMRPTVWATHYKGAEISYAHAGGTTYTLTITEYYDCSGLTGPYGAPAGLLSFNWITGCNNPLPTALGASWTLDSDVEVTPLLPSVIPGGATDCGGQPGGIAGVRQLVYSRDFDFSGIIPCPLEIGYGDCCRGNLLNNLQTPGSVGWYTRTQIWDYPLNNTSPQWLDPSFVIVDEGMPALVSMAAFDPDGDSLSYALDSLSANYGIGSIFNPSYSLDFPFGINAPVWLDPLTGHFFISAYANLLGEYAVAVTATEWRNGQILSKSRRDFVVQVLIGGNNSNESPRILSMGGSFPTPTGATYIDSTLLTATAGVPISIPIQAVDVEGDMVTMTWSKTPPGATFSDQATGMQTDTVFGLDPVALFEWTPPAAGYYTFNVKLNDPTQFVYNFYSYALIVSPAPALSVDLGVDSLTLCVGDSLWLVPQLQNGTAPFTYLWNTGSTIDSLLVDQAGLYMLTVVDDLGATVTDSVYVSLSPYIADAGADITVCEGQSGGSIGTSATPGASYQWSPVTGLLNTTSATAFFNGPAGTYTYAVEMIGPDGCVTTDSVEVIALVDTLSGPLLSVMGPDTICVGDTLDLIYLGPNSMNVVLSPSWGDAIVVSGTGAGPFELRWNSSGDKVVHFSISDGICVADDSITVYVAPACVWPGDADDDGIANNNDLLAIGLVYAATGSSRANASLTWSSQSAGLWADSLPSGVNAVYADTDGNGLVNDDDTLAISLNYGLTHNKSTGTKGGPGDPPLLILPTVDSTQVGDTLLLPIVLGLDTLTADSIYGLAFTITYDPALVDSGNTSIQYSGWLGTYGTDLIGIQKDDYSNGFIDVALSRTDLQPMSGYGGIANLSIVMIDDIAGKTDLAETLTFDITNVRVIRPDGTEQAVDAQPATIVLTQEVALGLNPGLGTTLKVYPQPAREALFIEMGEAQDWNATLYSLSGQALRALNSRRRTRETMSLHGLAPGLYLLRIQNAQGVALRKVEVR